jgi:hypothetical protein
MKALSEYSKEMKTAPKSDGRAPLVIVLPARVRMAIWIQPGRARPIARSANHSPETREGLHG